MVVDAHAHVIVPGLGADVEWVDGAQVVTHNGRSIRSALREFSDVPRILDEQERQNEALASYVSDRVWALGTATTADELVAAMEDGRLSGVEIPATQLGD